MDSNATKIGLIKWITALKDKAILNRLQIIQKEEIEKEWLFNISENEKNAYDSGKEDIKNGKLRPSEEVMKNYEK